MFRAFIIYLTFLLTIKEVLAENERIDDVSYNNMGHRSEGVKFDGYPMVVPKRAALLLDRIMVALQRALEDEDGIPPGKVVRQPLLIDQTYPEYDNEPSTPMELGLIKDEHGPQPRLAPKDLIDLESRQAQQKMMGLQRRGHGTTVHPKGRVWRCYFNAITCFKK